MLLVKSLDQDCPFTNSPCFNFVLGTSILEEIKMTRARHLQ